MSARLSVNKEPLRATLESEGMRLLLNEAVKSGHPDHSHHLTLLRRNPNDQPEVHSFVEQVMRERGLSQPSYLVIGSTMPLVRSLRNDDLTSAAFLNGAAMDGPIRRHFASALLQHLKGVIVVVEHEPTEMFREDFIRFCTKTLRWPHWSERQQDHRGILTEIHKRLNMPSGRSKPELSKEAMERLLAYPFSGTGHAERVIKEALNLYIKWKHKLDLDLQHIEQSLRRLELNPPQSRTAE